MIKSLFLAIAVAAAGCGKTEIRDNRKISGPDVAGSPSKELGSGDQDVAKPFGLLCEQVRPASGTTGAKIRCTTIGVDLRKDSMSLDEVVVVVDGKHRHTISHFTHFNDAIEFVLPEDIDPAEITVAATMTMAGSKVAARAEVIGAEETEPVEEVAVAEAPECSLEAPAKEFISCVWTPVAGIDDYVLSVSPLGQPDTAKVVQVSGKNQARVKMPEEGTFVAKVRAVSVTISSTTVTWSPLSTQVMIDRSAPEVPAIKNVTLAKDSAGNHLAQINWDAVNDVGPAGVASYVLQVGTATGGADILDQSFEKTVTSHQLVLVPGEYFVRVAAIDGQDYASAWSPEHTFTVVEDQPPAPLLAPTDEGVVSREDQTRFEWIAELSTGQEFEVEVTGQSQTDPAGQPGPDDVVTLHQTTDSFLEIDVETGRTYRARVRVIEVASTTEVIAWSDLSDGILVDRVAPTNQVPTFAAAAEGDTKLTINWSAEDLSRVDGSVLVGSGIASYQILVVSDPQDVTNTKVVDLAVQASTLSDPPTFQFDATDGQIYFASVQTTDAAGNVSAWSDFSEAGQLYQDPGVSKPELRAKTYTVQEDEDLVETLGKAVVAADQIASYQITQSPLVGTLTLVDAATGDFRYEPPTDHTGDETFQFKATGSNGGVSDPGTVTITIQPVNDRPVVQTLSLNGLEDQVLRGTIAATDVDHTSTELRYRLGTTAPAHGTATIDAAGQVVYTPDADYFGTDRLTYVVEDWDGLEAVEEGTIDVRVDAVDDRPTAQNASYNMVGTEVLSRTLVGDDLEGDAIHTYQVTTSPTFGTLAVNDRTGAFTFSPNRTAAGSTFFEFRVQSQSLWSETARVDLTVTASKPQVQAVALSGDEDQVQLGSLADGAVDRDEVASFRIAAEPSEGALTLTNATTGEFRYTPPSNFHGEMTWDFKAVGTNGVESDAATVTMTIRAVNDRPVALDGDLTGAEDTTIQGTLTADDPDDDSSALIFSLGDTSPSHGTVSIAANGRATYEPAANYHGSDQFSFRVKDASDLASERQGTVTVTVTPQDDRPVAFNERFTGSGITGISSGQLRGEDVDGDPILEFETTSNPYYGTLNVNASTGIFSYSPRDNKTVVDYVFYRVRARDGWSDPKKAEFAMTRVERAPVFADQSWSRPEGAGPRSERLIVSHPDYSRTQLSFRITRQPDVGTAALPRHGTVSYTPVDGDWTGTADWEVEVTAPNGLSTKATVTVTVTPVNDAPVAAAQDLELFTGESRTVVLDASDAEEDPLRYEIDDVNTRGTVTLLSGGQVRYEAPSSSTSSDYFEYRVVEDRVGGLASDKVRVRFTIRPKVVAILDGVDVTSQVIGLTRKSFDLPDGVEYNSPIPSKSIRFRNRSSEPARATKISLGSSFYVDAPVEIVIPGKGEIDLKIARIPLGTGQSYGNLDIEWDGAVTHRFRADSRYTTGAPAEGTNPSYRFVSVPDRGLVPLSHEPTIRLPSVERHRSGSADHIRSFVVKPYREDEIFSLEGAPGFSLYRSHIDGTVIGYGDTSAVGAGCAPMRIVSSRPGADPSSLTICGEVTTTGGWTLISSRADLEKIRENPKGNFKLTANISMGSEPFRMLPVFNGLLDGAGYRITGLKNFQMTPGGLEKHVTYRDKGVGDFDVDGYITPNDLTLMRLIESDVDAYRADYPDVDIPSISRVHFGGGIRDGINLLSGYFNFGPRRSENRNLKNESTGLEFHFMRGTLGGLIGELNGTVKNLTLDQAEVAGGYAGILAGHSRYGVSLHNVQVQGVVTGMQDVGGVIGRVQNGRFRNVHSNIDLYSNGVWTDSIGGLAGYFQGSVDSASARGKVSGRKLATGGAFGKGYGIFKNVDVFQMTLLADERIGGLIGQFYGEIDNCSANTTLTSLMEGTRHRIRIDNTSHTIPRVGEYDGGLVSKGVGTIKNSNARGTWASAFFGGLASEFQGTIESSFAIGEMLDHKDGREIMTGSSAGLVHHMQGTIDRSFSAVNIQRVQADYGGLVGLFDGRTIPGRITKSFSVSQMMSTQGYNNTYGHTRNGGGLVGRSLGSLLIEDSFVNDRDETYNTQLPNSGIVAYAARNNAGLVGMVEEGTLTVRRAYVIMDMHLYTTYGYSGYGSKHGVALTDSETGELIDEGSFHNVLVTHSEAHNGNRVVGRPNFSSHSRSQMQSQGTYSGWDFTTVWHPPGTAGKLYPTLRGVPQP